MLFRLCWSIWQVAKVDAFEISQYELYSSRVKEFEVRGRQTHPRGQGSDYSKALNTSGWQLLGKYSAAKSRGTQARSVIVFFVHKAQTETVYNVALHVQFP